MGSVGARQLYLQALRFETRSQRRSHHRGIERRNDGDQQSPDALQILQLKEGLSMSWQATAYVKTLTNVTVYEKLLLFVLADYHNTHRGASYPSVPRLAEEALMKERNCYD